MMGQPCYGEEESQRYYHSNYRPTHDTGYPHRSVPYAPYHHDLRHSLKADIFEGQTNRTTDHDMDVSMLNEPTRRRVSVACSRCRRRKIRCSGNPGDNTGCQACRVSGADPSQCTFVRVGSETWALRGEDIEAHNVMTDTNENRPSTSRGPIYDRDSDHRSTLPRLQSRSALPSTYNPPYDGMSVDVYGYASPSYPRHDSIANSYGVPNYRYWGTAAPSTTANTISTLAEPQTSYAHGMPYASSMPPEQQRLRLPSVTGESSSALNMGHLNAYLPMQKKQERHLPVPAPYAAPYHPANHPLAEVPQIRPLSSVAQPQVQETAFHGRSNTSWASDGGPTVSGKSYVPTMTGTAGTLIPPQQSGPSVSGPGLGYQFNENGSRATSSSGRVSPTSGMSANERFGDQSKPPAMSMTHPVYTFHEHDVRSLPPIVSDEKPSVFDAVDTGSPFVSYSADKRGRSRKCIQTDKSNSAIFDGHEPQPAPLQGANALRATNVGIPRRQHSSDEQHNTTAQSMSLARLKSKY